MRFALTTAAMALLLCVGPLPVYAVSTTLVMAVVDEESRVTRPQPPDVPRLPESLVPPELRDRDARRQGSGTVDSTNRATLEQERVITRGAAPSFVPSLPQSLRRLLPGLLPLVELQQSAGLSQLPGQVSPVPKATQLEVFGSELSRPAAAQSRVSANRVVSEPRVPTIDKKWVPERTLPRIGTPVLTQSSRSRW